MRASTSVVSGTEGLCLSICLPLGPTFLCHADTVRQASACLYLVMGPALWKASEAAFIALPKYYNG